MLPVVGRGRGGHISAVWQHGEAENAAADEEDLTKERQAQGLSDGREQRSGRGTDSRLRPSPVAISGSGGCVRPPKDRSLSPSRLGYTRAARTGAGAVSHAAVRKMIDVCLYKHGYKAPGQLGYHGSSQRVRQAYLLFDRPRNGIVLDLLRRKLTHIGVRLPPQRWRAFFVDVLAGAGVAVGADADADALPPMPFKVFVTDVLLPEAASSVPTAAGNASSNAGGCAGASSGANEVHPVMGFVSGCTTLPSGGHMRARRAHPAEIRSGSTRSAFEAKAPAQCHPCPPPWACLRDPDIFARL